MMASQYLKPFVMSLQTQSIRHAIKPYQYWNTYKHLTQGLKMKTYKITVEIVLKDASIERNDFIYQIIEQSLENTEQILDYDLIEVTK
jgi:hypothetical protein